MRFINGLLSTVLLAAVAHAVQPMRSVLISYPDGTSDATVDAGKEAIVQAGGQITHEYTIFQGFAANAPAQALEVSALTDSGATIEDDSPVHINNAEKHDA